LTRPEPTIIGNCEGWSFIVGKKSRKQSPKNTTLVSLQLNNSYFIHRLSTIQRIRFCTTCGWSVDQLWGSCRHPIWWIILNPYTH